jgi:ubiquinone/menaquinone biosynthesis C-methylase UbiE
MTSKLTEKQQEIVSFWNSPAGYEGYDTYPGHGLLSEAESQAWQMTLRRLLPPPPRDVLDVGTGTGFLALLLGQMNYQVTGIDLSEKMLTEAKQKAADLVAPPSFELGNAEDPPFPPASFDIICNRLVLWTLLSPQLALIRWHGLLRPGGMVIAIEWIKENSGSSWEPYSSEVRSSLPLWRAKSSATYIEMFQDAGFMDVKAIPLPEIYEAEKATEWALPRTAICGWKNEHGPESSL